MDNYSIFVKLKTTRTHSGIILEGDSETFAHFSAKNHIGLGLIREKSHGKM